jgi:hypothetical protein
MPSADSKNPFNDADPFFPMSAVSAEDREDLTQNDASDSVFCLVSAGK